MNMAMENGKPYTFIDIMKIFQSNDDDNMYIFIQNLENEPELLKIQNNEDLYLTIKKYKQNFSIFSPFKDEATNEYWFTATWNYGEYMRQADILTISSKAYYELMRHVKE